MDPEFRVNDVRFRVMTADDSGVDLVKQLTGIVISGTIKKGAENYGSIAETHFIDSIVADVKGHSQDVASSLAAWLKTNEQTLSRIHGKKWLDVGVILAANEAYASFFFTKDVLLAACEAGVELMATTYAQYESYNSMWKRFIGSEGS